MHLIYLRLWCVEQTFCFRHACFFNPNHNAPICLRSEPSGIVQLVSIVLSGHRDEASGQAGSVNTILIDGDKTLFSTVSVQVTFESNIMDRI